MADVPHLAYPFQLNTRGSAAVVNEQDDDNDIIDCVEVLLSTERGERIELPDYGLEDPAFRMNGADGRQIVSVIEEWEPRATIDFDDDELEELVQTVRLRVIGRTHG